MARINTWVRVMTGMDIAFIETDPRLEEFLLEEDEESYEASFQEEIEAGYPPGWGEAYGTQDGG